MKNLKEALELRRKYNKMDLVVLIEKFENFSNQIIPEKCKSEFDFTGLNNIDFITCGFLEEYGLKSL